MKKIGMIVVAGLLVAVFASAGTAFANKTKEAPVVSVAASKTGLAPEWPDYRQWPVSSKYTGKYVLPVSQEDLPAHVVSLWVEVGRLKR